MKLFDTHCHFDVGADIPAILQRATAVGVERIMAVGGSVELNQTAVDASRFGCLSALGYDRDQIDQPLPELPEVKLAAYGEIGLDYYYSPETRKKQLAHFLAQLEEAKHRGLPVIIHTRDADEDTLSALREVPSFGVIHCFTGSPDFARKLLDIGFYISISGIVTFRLADNVRESALVVPDDRLLIETDSPFLAPVPKRGNANEPAFLVHTCEFLAKLRGISADALAAITYANAERLFG